MKISLNWLSDYVELPASPEELASRLTMAGLEVEGVTRPGQALKGVLVGQVKESSRHPNADRLSVTRIDVGRAELLQVVCGATNYKVGDRVCLATPGTKLPNGVEIKVSALRGVESQGMLCSARELGISEDASGLLILGAEAALGGEVAKALGLDDVYFDVNVTPNRPDVLSHFGLAREVAALTGKPLRAPTASLVEAAGSAADKVRIRIEDPARCPRYAARVIEGVSIGPSPEWMQARLRACGVRAINAVVDVTNYALLEYGQPLHAFDLDRLAGPEIVVRRSRAGERMVTLDGKDRVLDVDDLLVCDRDRGQVLAGVMGGADSEVSPKTTRVLLECAHFLPATVRRSSRRHGLHTESSHRFERGTDVELVPTVLDRAAALIAELASGRVLKGRVDVYPSPGRPRVVELREGRASEVLGTPLGAERERSVLGALGFTAQGRSGWQVPSFRLDVEGEVDLIEEVARVVGYDHIPARMPQGGVDLSPEPLDRKVEQRVRSALASAGFDEVVNYSFVAPQELDALGERSDRVGLANPLSTEQSVMRTTLLAGLLSNASRNARHQVESMRLYEVGRVFWPDPAGAQGTRPPALEPWRVAGVLAGSRAPRSWTSQQTPVDFYDAKGAVETILASLAVGGVKFEPVEVATLHPRAAAVARLGAVSLGVVGELHPRVTKRLGLPSGLFVFELDLDALTAAANLEPRYLAPSRYPSVFRDLAVVVPIEQRHDQIRQLVLDVGAPLVADARLFDVYTGKPIPEGKKNLAFALEFASSQKTLTDGEVGEAHARIVAEVERRLGASLRGGSTNP